MRSHHHFLIILALDPPDNKVLVFRRDLDVLILIGNDFIRQQNRLQHVLGLETIARSGQIRPSRAAFVAKAMAGETLSHFQRLFAALADPNNLAGLIPRVRRVEMMDRQPDQARIVTQMSIGPFSNIRSEGDVRWQDDREVVFSSRTPLPVEARWTLIPSGSGTELQAALSLDLTPLIGILAAFVPEKDVVNMVGPDLDAALAEVARRVERKQ